MAPMLPVAMIRDFGTSRFRRSCGQNTPLLVMEEGQKADASEILESAIAGPGSGAIHRLRKTNLTKRIDARVKPA